MQYTDAGDVKQYSLSGGPWEQVYDGEGRLLRVEQAGGTKMVEYDYDAEGRRVRRVAGAVTTHFAYDAGGQLMGEYGGPVAATGRQYLVADHLGSTRMVVSGGVCINRFDYAPFGGEVDRAGEPCYGSSAEPRQKFTGKERDTETGLDYFDARYFSGAQGRFTSPDPWNAGADPSVAQSWNGYSYALNNPLAYMDPTGLGPCPVDSETGEEKPCLAGLLYEHFLRQQMEILRQTTETAHQAFDWLSRPRDPGCMASGMAIGGAAGGVGGAAVGVAGGPAVPVTVPVASGIGFLGGSALGGIGGLVACSKGTGDGGGGGASAGSGGGFKKPKAGLSGKEAASDVPSWAKGQRPMTTETGKEFAHRLLNGKYGQGNYPKGPGSEFNKIQKWGDRAFE